MRRTRLNEALEQALAPEMRGLSPEHRVHLASVARAVLSAPTVRWCTVHDRRAGDHWCNHDAATRRTCNITTVALVPLEADETVPRKTRWITHDVDEPGEYV